MKKMLAVVVVLVVLIPIGYIAWEKEWFVSTPSSVFKDTLAKANAGNYQAAIQNLPTGQRKEMLDDPQLMKKVWEEWHLLCP